MGWHKMRWELHGDEFRDMWSSSNDEEAAQAAHRKPKAKAPGINAIQYKVQIF
jgi:hypothetical protein